jgi:hypothetical protein
MIVTTQQPIFLSWPGFFYKALCAVPRDMVQFPLGRRWMTRNRLKGDQGKLWLRVPVWKRRERKQVIRDVMLCGVSNWRRKHRLCIREQYAHAPYLETDLPPLEAIHLPWDAPGLECRLLVQLDISLFHKHDLRLCLVSFRPPVYPQLLGLFRYNLPTLDPLPNCGPKSRDLIADAGVRK